MAASDHLFNISAIKKIRQVKNEIITSNSGRKIKATSLVKLLHCFAKWMLCVALGKLQIPNSLQYRFKTFKSRTTRIIGDQNGV